MYDLHLCSSSDASSTTEQVTGDAVGGVPDSHELSGKSPRCETAVYADAESNTDLDITCALRALRASTDGTPATRKQRLRAYVAN